MDKDAKHIEPMQIETVEPIGKRILIRKDEDKKETKGGKSCLIISKFRPSQAG